MNKGLNLNCTIHLNKYTKYKVLFKDNTAAVDLRVPFKNGVATFTTNMGKIDKVAARANADLDGITEAKKNSKQTGSDGFAVITSNAYTFASDNNLTALKKQMNNNTSNKLFAEKDENFVSRCSKINEVLTQVLVDYPAVALEYFTADQLTAAMLLVADFDDRLGNWAVANVDVENAKVEFEVEWMPKMAILLVDLEKLLPGSIKTTHPKFVSAFIALKKLVRVGVKDQGLHPTMVDAETGDLFINTGMMETMNYTGTQKVDMTNSSGLFDLMKLKVGIWTIKFSAVGYIDQIILVKVSAKKVEKPEVKLEKIVVLPEELPMVEEPTTV